MFKGLYRNIYIDVFFIDMLEFYYFYIAFWLFDKGIYRF